MLDAGDACDHMASFVRVNGFQNAQNLVYSVDLMLS
jgi:hypothetical protein